MELFRVVLWNCSGFVLWNCSGLYCEIVQDCTVELFRIVLWNCSGLFCGIVQAVCFQHRFERSLKLSY